MPAVVLAPRQLAFEQARVGRGHLRHAIILGHTDIPRAEQAENRTRRHRSHVAALLVEPVRVALLRDAVADERRPRRAERDQLVRVDRDVVRVLAPERPLCGAVLQEIAGHPVVLPGSGEVLDRFARLDLDDAEHRLVGVREVVAPGVEGGP